jgi:hypothetical protein
MRTLLLIFLLLAASRAVPCYAGGSIGWDRVNAEITKGDPFLAAFIAAHFDVAPAGGALRVGHDHEGNSLVPGHEVGDRLPPYEFRAKSKGVAGDYTFYLTFEPISFDNGKTTMWQVTIRKKREAE